MGCGCKGDKKSPNLVNEETGELNIKGKLLKIPMAFALTLLMIILSPFLVVLVWWIAIKSIFGSNSDIVNLVLSNFKKKMVVDKNNEPNIEELDFNEDDYEIVGVDIIK
jgi:hypothetical protein